MISLNCNLDLDCTALRTFWYRRYIIINLKNPKLCYSILFLIFLYRYIVHRKRTKAKKAREGQGRLGKTKEG
jgi:hypothetical protein